MRQVKIEKIALRNFKGVRELDVELGQYTLVCGANATGKTTIFDAFTWCLFGKDHLDRTDTGRGAFAVKTQDAAGATIPHLDHEVTILLQVNGVEIELTRRLSEKWVKKARAKTTTFEGNTTTYIWNGNELKESEYNRRIEAEIIDARTFKMLTNPHYFSELPWQEQLAVLTEIVGTVTLADVAGDNPERLDIIKGMTSSDSLAEKRTQNKTERSRLQKRLNEIEPQIKGIQTATPPAQDWEALEKEKAEIDNQLAALINEQQQITNREKAVYDSLQQLTHEDYTLRAQVEKIKHEALAAKNQAATENNNRIELIKMDLTKAQHENEHCTQSIAQTESRTNEVKKEMEATLESNAQKREKLLQEWEEENSRIFKAPNDGTITCPLTGSTCDSQMAATIAKQNTDKARAAFNEEKLRRLDAIEARGKAVNASTKETQDYIAKIEYDAKQTIQGLEECKAVTAATIERLTAELQSLAPQPVADQLTAEELEAIPELAEVQARLAEIEQEKAKLQTTATEPTADTTQRLAELRGQADEKAAALSTRHIIENNQQLIAKLEAESDDIAQQMADYEAKDDTMREMEEELIAEVGNRANKLCRFVKFRTCDKQINGEPVRTCYATVDGVRWADINSAKQTNAGLDIINAIGRVKEISLPIFIDNAEGINELEKTDAQVVKLQVTYDDPLKIYAE